MSRRKCFQCADGFPSPTVMNHSFCMSPNAYLCWPNPPRHFLFVAELVKQEPSANWKSLDVSSQRIFLLHFISKKSSNYDETAFKVTTLGCFTPFASTALAAFTSSSLIMKRTAAATTLWTILVLMPL